MINLFLPSKKTLLIIGLFGVLIVILALASLFSTTPSTNQIPLITPSPKATQTPLTNFPPLGQPPASTVPYPQIFQTGTVEKNYERIVNKKELTESEKAIKQKLIAPLNGGSGVIYKTDEFNIEYLKTPQYFMIQIQSTNIAKSKESAQQWLTNQGFPTEAICNLPVIFYLTTEVSRYLQENKLQFDPTPKGCQ